MTADAEGNDLEKVFIPVTGFLAVQLTGEPTWVDPTEGSATPLVLPEGYVKVGLFKQDGGRRTAATRKTTSNSSRKATNSAGSRAAPCRSRSPNSTTSSASSPPARPPTPTA